MARDATYRAGYLLSGIEADRVFDALLDVGGFPEWAVGLGRVGAKHPAGHDISVLVPGAELEFVLSAAGLTHTVRSRISTLEPPHTLEWRYLHGASGRGGWYVEPVGQANTLLSLATDYHVSPAWLDRLAHRPFFRRLTEDLLKRSIRRLESRIRSRS